MTRNDDTPAAIRMFVENTPRRWVRDGKDALPPFKSASLTPRPVPAGAEFRSRPGCVGLDLLYSYIEGWLSEDWGSAEPLHSITVIRAAEAVDRIDFYDFEQDVDAGLWEGASLWCFAQTIFGEEILFVEGDAPVSNGSVVYFDSERVADCPSRRRWRRAPTAFVILAESMEEWLRTYCSCNYDDIRLFGAGGFRESLEDGLLDQVPAATLLGTLERFMELNPGVAWPRRVLDELH